MQNQVCWYCGNEVGWVNDGELERHCINCGVLNDRNPYIKQKEGKGMILEDRNWLKTADINGGETVTFKDGGEWVESKNYKNEDGSPKQQFVIKVQILDLVKDMALNKTNRDNMKAAFGKDTSAWIEKEATLEKEKVMVAGKKMDTIVVTPIMRV